MKKNLFAEIELKRERFPHCFKKHIGLPSVGTLSKLHIVNVSSHESPESRNINID